MPGPREPTLLTGFALARRGGIGMGLSTGRAI
jgi:hypothetical protein